eukprot:3814108-Amphidinium_carterae.1
MIEVPPTESPSSCPFSGKPSGAVTGLAPFPPYQAATLAVATDASGGHHWAAPREAEQQESLLGG